MATTTRRAFRLPTTVAFLSHRRGDGKYVAHSLEFDLVAVADDEDQADKKLRRAVKTYIEYGLSNGWTDDIIFLAPSICLEKAAQATVARPGEPIWIDDDRMLVFRATIDNHERGRAACPATA